MPLRATAHTIWSVPAYLPYLQPALTAETVRAAEAQLGRRLPAAYLELLAVQNGGYLRYSLKESAHSVIAGIGPHYPSLTGFDWQETQQQVSFPLAGLVPFDGDGHWFLCLDYRSGAAEAAVTMVDIECDGQERVAHTFADYLACLELDIEDEWVLQTRDLQGLKADLAKRLGTRFDEPDTFLHGYLIERAALGVPGRSEWLWLEPNRVPRGFARPNEPRYAELKDLLPGTAERFPGLPPDSYLLSATEGVRARVLAACREAGVDLQSLHALLS